MVLWQFISAIWLRVRKLEVDYGDSNNECDVRPLVKLVMFIVRIDHIFF